jgi:metallo-beta-lactamase family protein
MLYFIALLRQLVFSGIQIDGTGVFMKIRFIGATESVTGSKHLITTAKGYQILLDCGLYQGFGKDTHTMNCQLDLDPAQLDAVILSHGHIDHCGNLPSLIAKGFKGKIYCTPATRDVCNILLLDSAHIQESEQGEKHQRKDHSQHKPLYTIAEAERCLNHFEAVPFDTDVRLNEEAWFYFSQNGHVIGSAAVNLTVKEGNKITRLTFTGDIGRYNDPLLKPPSAFQQADYIICESTYGNRVHDVPEDIERKLLGLIIDTCLNKKGKLVIPAFSLGRTQQILYLLDKLANKKQLPDVPVYVDSPMSVKATGVVRSHAESFNEELQQYLKRDSDPFGFMNLVYIEEARESRRLNQLDEPCVIVAASGMADAGRVQHHLCHTINDARNAVLITGYCSPSSLGAKLMRGARQVHIMDYLFDVNAEVHSIQSLSAHGDREEMIRFLSCQNKNHVKGIFLVHGEADAKAAFGRRLAREGYRNIKIPRKNEEIELH